MHPPRFPFPRLLAAALLLTSPLPTWSQGYGLGQRTAAGAYLDGALPAAEASTTGWSFADAFPALSFNDPTFIVPLPGSDRLLVGTQQGLIHSFVDSPTSTTKTLFLDLSAVTQGTVGSGMMGIAFHPQFGVAGAPNRNYLYIFYSYSPTPNYDPGAPSEGTASYNRLSRFTVPDGSTVADRNSELILINQYDRHLWHAGGALFFGTDGFLYLSCGDEGGNNDPYNHGNKINDGLFCGVLRIDVDQDASRSHPIRRQPLSGAPPPAGWPATYTQHYYIPNDNPWLDAGGAVLEEFFALGFRNPHRMTYDAASNRIWLGDVGQSTREEVNVVEKGGNYQWGFMEGKVSGAKPRPNPVIGVEKPPVFDYPHTNGYTCVIGGYVYRGTEFAPWLEGKYLFGDNGTARIRALSYDGSSTPQVIELTTIPHGGGETTGMSTFGLDHNNEILMCCAGPGVKIYKLTKPGGGVAPPALLSQTGAFTDLATLTPSPALIPYTVNAPLWSDHSVKTRWMVVPNDGAPFAPGETVGFSAAGAWNFPIGTVFVKHFELPVDDTNPAIRKRLETRFLVRASDGSYYGLTYKWRADHSEADLLPGGLNEVIPIVTSTGTREQTWSYPSRQDCIVCHTANAGSVLGVRTCQLNGDLTYPGTGVTDNQLRTLSHIGIFSSALDEAGIPTLPKSASIADSTASLELRVRSYLDANCAHCHRPGGVKANFDGRLETPLASQGLIRGEVFDPLGITGAKLIVPSDVGKSMLRHRDNLLGTNQMPPLARNVVDTDYIGVLTQWINSLPPNFTLPGGVFVSQIPATIGDDGNYELGMKFRTSQSGAVTAIRYYRPPLETGAHIGRLWSSAGGLLATVTFPNETASGWQTATLAAPVPLDAATTYVVSVNNNSHYAFSEQALATSVVNGPLSSVADGANGVFSDTPGVFPTGSFRNSNYFRDVLFTVETGPGPGDDTTPVNVFTAQVPAAEVTDNSDYELGMKFRTTRPGVITELRYYRPALETGPHVGRLWTIGGVPLATATFTGESAGGWQTASLPAPVVIAANATYVVSVNANTHYTYTGQGLAAAVTNGSIASVADGANGVFHETSGVFPTASFQNTNYFRDVLFTPFSAFQQWKIAAGLPYSFPHGDDSDRNGLTLLLEYALGADPWIPTPAIPPSWDGANYAFYRARADLTYTVEIGTDLIHWTPHLTNPGTVGQIVTVPAPVGATRLFLRLKVSSP